MTDIKSTKPSFEQLWQALRVLFGPDLQAASLNVLIIKDGTVVYDSFIFPPKDKHD